MENKKWPKAADSLLHLSFQVSDALVVQVEKKLLLVEICW